ncbi:MAG: ribosome maturation factor RimM [Cyanobacteria bacterium J06635_10]
MDDWLEIGKIVAPQGLNGELRVYPSTDFPERFEKPGLRWLLHPNATELEEVELVKGRFLEGKKLYVIQLAGVKYRDQAEKLRGCKLFVHQSSRPQLAEDEYHLMDLLGLSVFIQDSGEFIGTVVDLIAAGNDLLEVRLEKEAGDKETVKDLKTVLIPFVKDIVPVVDLETRRIEITPPLGLLEIN